MSTFDRLQDPVLNASHPKNVTHVLAVSPCCQKKMPITPPVVISFPVYLCAAAL